MAVSKPGKTGANQYTTAQNVLYIFQNLLRDDPAILFYLLLFIPLNVVSSFLGIYITSSIVGYASLGDERHLLTYILLLAVLQAAAAILLQYANSQTAARSYNARMRYTKEYMERYMSADYTLIESVNGMARGNRAKTVLFNYFYGRKTSVENVPVYAASLLSSVLGMFVYAGIISVLNPLLILFLIGIAAISYGKQLAVNSFYKRERIESNEVARRIRYISDKIKDAEYAKDIKLYKTESWFADKYRAFMHRLYHRLIKRAAVQFSSATVITILNIAFTAYVYLYLINQFAAGAIDAAQFVLQFGLITSFNAWLKTIIDTLEGLHIACTDVDDVRKFLDLAGDSAVATNSRPALSEYSIRFDNVSFVYPSTRKRIFHRVSFEIRQGEKIAVVGLNGAGKTTMVKLLCGLYAPAEGQIRIGGQDIAGFDREYLFGLFSVVFQDVYFLPASMEKNVTLSAVTDPERFARCVELSGIGEKLAALPGGAGTRLCKGVLDDSAALSGGEMQKLAMARALYKNGDIILLDEPTAALDPIAENEMYLRYNELTGGKTTIFISHRLSSTRFCDKIFFLENGEIAEVGTHAELMERQGKYAALYEVQSRYYKSNAEGEVL